MPELPEVETIRRGLEAELAGARVAEVELRPCRIFRTSPEAFSKRLPGQSFRAFRRRGKFLVFELDDCFWIVHLGMTGQMTVRHPDRSDSPGFLKHPATGLQRARQHPPDRHTHLLLALQDGRAVLYRDVRKFGRQELLERDETMLEEYFASLGLEPLSSEYSWEAFRAGLRGRRLAIKAALLQQNVVAGVGNIYADEALFQAGVHPSRLVHRIRMHELRDLFEAIPKVLSRGIRFGGTSLRDYVNSDGAQGSNQNELEVYGRAGQPCPRCGWEIQRIVVSQRGTHFCLRCQPRQGRRAGGP